MLSLLNNDRAFSEFFHLHYAPLVLFAYGITDDHAAAEDIAENAFVKLWINRESVYKIKNLKSYLFAIAKNDSFSWLRSRKSELARNKKIQTFEEDLKQSALESMIYSETMAKIYAEMDKLPAQCRKVFINLYLEGKTIGETARELRLAETTVRTHNTRGLIILRRLLYWVLLFSPFWL